MLCTVYYGFCGPQKERELYQWWTHTIFCRRRSIIEHLHLLVPQSGPFVINDLHLDTDWLMSRPSTAWYSRKMAYQIPFFEVSMDVDLFPAISASGVLISDYGSYLVDILSPIVILVLAIILLLIAFDFVALSQLVFLLGWVSHDIGRTLSEAFWSLRTKMQRNKRATSWCLVFSVRRGVHLHKVLFRSRIIFPKTSVMGWYSALSFKTRTATQNRALIWSSE